MLSRVCPPPRCCPRRRPHWAGLLGWWLLCLLPGRGQAQPEARNWKFGYQCGISFPAGSGPAVATPPGPMTAVEGCASISDAAGVLQCYSNGVEVWDRAGTRMPNGQLSGGDVSATQGALLLRRPGSLTEYCLFTVDAFQNRWRGCMRYSVIDMRLRGGLGDVSARNSVPVQVPGGALLTEKLTAVRHSNGRDYWIVVHGWQNDLFYCYLLSSTGLAASPVISAGGLVHSGTTPGADNSVGYLRASPSGRLLAAAVLGQGLDLFNFDPATGVVGGLRAQRRASPSAPYYYGLEFSADNSKLYYTTDRQVIQLDLANNLALTPLPTTLYAAQSLQRGPDGKIYVSYFDQFALGIIQQPNASGLGCNLVDVALPLPRPTGAPGFIGLPNFPNDFGPELGLEATAACVGGTVQFSAFSTLTNSVFTWDFGEAGSPANTATGPSVAHAYAQANSYTVTLTATPLAGGAAVVTRQTIVAAPVPTLSLGARQRQLCAGQTLTLAPVGGPVSGITYHWQDGLSAPVRQVQAAGRYVLTATAPGGCSTRDSVDVQVLPAPLLRLLPPAVLCPSAPGVVLQPSAQPPGTTYRWQDGSTTETYLARQPGRYRLVVRSAAGCLATDSVEVRGWQTDGECEPINIPNIFTPNGDGTNDCFVAQGLLPGTWALHVYNRWGQLIFSHEHYANQWDAAGQPAGVYYYLLQKPGTSQRYQGWVEVMK